MKKAIVSAVMGLFMMGSANAAIPGSEQMLMVIGAGFGAVVKASNDAEKKDKCYRLPLVTEKAKGGGYSFDSTAREAGTCK